MNDMSKFYPEDELVQKFQNGEIGWLDYVQLHSPEWQEDYSAYCMENGLFMNEESAEAFVQHMSELMEQSME